MASVTAGTRDQEVSFISGVNADGTLAGPAFATYNGDTPDTYGNTSGQFHWGPVNTAGTGGGLLNYYFDTNAGWNANEQESLVSGLNMWSAIANISFQQTTIAADANITFTRNANGDAFAQSSSQQHAVGSTIITPPDGNSVTISMDIGDSTRRVGGHGALGDFQSGGYGVSTVLHEEGHALGLGHGGPYNGNNVPSQQLGAYDNQISTTMSYFSPHGSTAYDSPVGATNWTTGGTQYYPTTWMPLDIDAIQRLYGAQTNGPLNTAQTFGYNTTITGSLKPYFDFTINTRPILTLYDTAASGNTLDLSMSSDAATLNLNSGTYSSAFGMTNNIVIYDKTYIQNVYCGSGDDICTVNSDKGNTIDGGAGNNKAIFSGNRADYVITEKNGSTQVSQASKPNGPVSTLSKIQTLQFNDQSVAVCFASGSLILLDRGEVAVERLRVGDVVVTASGEQRAIRWIGHRTIDCRNHPNPLAVLPVRIGKDALGPNKPAQDLWVSPGHAICLDVDGEVLIPASALVNGAAVTQVPVDTVTYWHVELDSHDLLVANGLPAESYLDMGNRRFFAQGSVVDLAALPDADAASRTHADFCRPFVGKGPLVDEVRARLRTRALENGWTLEQNAIAELHVGVGGQVIHPVLDGATARFRLPAGCGDVRLRSLASTPSGVSDSRDGRRLGVDLKRLALCDGRGVRREIGLDDARLGRGFYPVEPLASGGLHRWTDGDALLPRSLWQGDEEGHEGEVTLLVEVAKRDLLRWRAPGAGTEAGDADNAAPALHVARPAA